MTDGGDGGYVSLREYADRRLEDFHREFTARWEELQRAITLARDELDARLATMNEFRAQILSERGLFATREQVDLLKAWVDQATGRLQVWTVLSIILSVLVTLIIGAYTLANLFGMLGGRAGRPPWSVPP